MQSMRVWIGSVSTAFLFIGWAYSHTDEIPVVLAFLTACGFALGFAFPRRFLLSALILGAACPLDEILIGWKVIQAPFEGGHILAACIGLLPALFGATIGRFSRGIKSSRLQ